MNFKHLRAKKDQIYQKRLFQTLNGNRIHGHPFLEVPLNRCVSVDMLTSHSNKKTSTPSRVLVFFVAQPSDAISTLTGENTYDTMHAQSFFSSH